MERITSFSTEPDTKTELDASVHGMAKFLAGGKPLKISHPDHEEDEPALLPEDLVTPTTSIWVRRNIPNN